MDPYASDRFKMVENQLKPRGISQKEVLESFLAVPRHLFVPPTEVEMAYDDRPLPIGYGQTISQPYIVALMTQAAKLKNSSKVLEIGTGSGYQAAILSGIVNQVYTIERIKELHECAESVFKSLKYSNVEAAYGDGTLGWHEKGPFDAILVTAGAPVIPESLVEQLAINGRLIIPVGDALYQKLLAITKQPDGSMTEEVIELVRFVPLIGEQGWS